MAAGAELVHICAGCATHPALLPAPRRRPSPFPGLARIRSFSLRRRAVRCTAVTALPTRRKSWVKRVVIGLGAALFVLVAAVASFIGITMYRIDHAVHHVSVPASLLAKGKNDLLAVVRGPDQHEQIYVFHTEGAKTNILHIPGALVVATADGLDRPLSALQLDHPAQIVAALRKIGVPVGRYVGVDLHAVSPDSSLGRLALGKISISSILANPTGASSLLEAVASHVFLGPKTSVSSLLELMHVSTGSTIAFPITRTSRGIVAMSASVSEVMHHFL